jgi:hypothetical protein
MKVAARLGVTTTGLASSVDRTAVRTVARMVSFSCFGSLATFFESAAYNEHPAAGEGCLLQG